MHITLIGTIHLEKGQCNSDELHKIIEHINPEVIFEESTAQFTDMYYSDSFDIYCANNILLNRRPPVVPLEVKCIKRYKENHNVKILPVDIDIRQKLSEHQQEILSLYNTFFKYQDYIKLDIQADTLIIKEGFHFLNSNKFLDHLEKKEVLEKRIMEAEIEKDKLLNIYKLFRIEQFDKRENAMLQNIYKYSKENQYNKAVFFIGAGHLKSIIEKVKTMEQVAEINLNWSVYRTNHNS